VEPLRRGHQPFAKGFQYFSAPGTCRERVVDDQTARLPFALLVGSTSARVPRMLVHIKEQHRTVAPKHFLRPISVMHVPVCNQDPVDAMPPNGVPRADGNIVENTK